MEVRKRRTAPSGWRYAVIQERRCHLDLGEYDTCAIQASQCISRGYVVLEILHDITSDYLLAKELADSFTRQQLSPIHFRDAIRDFLL